MSSDWQTLADVWYRKREVYDMAWGDDSEMLRVCIVSGAPFGGPVACVPNQKEWQEVRGGMKPRLQIFTSAGKLISSIMWAHSGLVAMSWTSSELLACVFKDASVRTFSVFCEMIHYFTVDETAKAESVIQTSFWSDGVALLTAGCKIFINSSFEKTACTQFVDFGLTSLPLAICVIPPPPDNLLDAQVLVATSHGPVLLVERERHHDISLEDGPYQTFALSPSGSFLACLSNSGLFKVLAVKDLSQLLDVANIECRKQPKQMVWVGNDCIALYLQIATPSNSFQHVLFVGGPQNDWIPYQYDYPVHLVSECDGCRIVGTQKCEFLQRVPTSTEAIYGVGSCEPPAMLCYALERFEVGDVRAEESLRAIEELSDAINSCIDAASYEPDCATAQSLLKSAVFGRHFLNEKSNVYCKSFMETSRNLRICLALRGAPLEIPVTCAQLQEVTIAGMLTRLAQRRAHLLAVRICDWVGVSKDRVLIHWASVKIKHALSLTDEQLCTAIKQKFDACDGISYAEVAGVAAKAFRPNLAIMLLNNEPRGRDQVHLLLKLNEVGLAFEKACANGDPNLLHECLGTILALEQEGIMKLVTMIKENPQVMQLASNIFVNSLRSTCKREENFDRMQQVLHRLGKEFQATQASILNAYAKGDVNDRVNYLKDSAQRFAHGEGTDAEKASMQFCAGVANDEATLLKMQEQFQADAVLENWPGRDRSFLGLSVADTLTKLIVMNQTTHADRLVEKKLKMPEKRYCRIKVKALAKAQNFDELQAMAQLRTLPIGYEVIVDAFLSGGRQDLASQFVPKIKSFEVQAKYYSKMGMEREAQAAYARKDERTGGLLSSINIFSR